MQSTTVAALVFAASLALTFGAAWLARARASHGGQDEDLAGRGLNRWLIGLSAATTGNSGFVVTGAVGLGYAGGMQWLLLPLGWLLGDLVYWRLFPARLNKAARLARAITLSELLRAGLEGAAARWLAALVSLLLIVFLSTYTAAQWLAGKKFLSSVFHLSDFSALLLFASTIVAYSSLGGFRGSIYADFVQALIRIAGTLVALGAVAWFALRSPQDFGREIAAAGPAFLLPLPEGSVVAALGLLGGFACAAIGFGLGQPQIVSRYFAGSSPSETAAAQWIYIGFLQFTWIAMTVFGVLLRGVMPGLEDPETGLSRFFVLNLGAIATGIIFADIYATIASTANGILIAIAQTLQRDIVGGLFGIRLTDLSHKSGVTLLLGVATILLSFQLPGNVFSIALGSVAKIAAGIAGPVMIKALGWRHDGPSLLVSVLAGLAAAFAWSALGLGAHFNEAGVGIAASLLANRLVVELSARR